MTIPPNGQVGEKFSMQIDLVQSSSQISQGHVSYSFKLKIPFVSIRKILFKILQMYSSVSKFTNKEAHS